MSTDTSTTDAPIDLRSRMRISHLLLPDASQKSRQITRTKTANDIIILKVQGTVQRLARAVSESLDEADRFTI